MAEPPDFNSNTAEPWDDLYDPYFSSPEEAEKWDGVSEFAPKDEEVNPDGTPE